MDLFYQIFRSIMPPKKKHKTRSSESCFGAPAKLPNCPSLYTLKEVLAALAFEAEQESAAKPSKTMFEKVEREIRLKFLQANPKLPLISIESAVKKMQRDFDDSKLMDRKQLTAKKKKNLQAKLYKILDLISCQCPIVECNREDHDCSGVHIACKCPKGSSRVPDIEAAWLKDQRDRDGSEKGQYMMKGIDFVETSAHQRAVTRSLATAKAEKNREARVEHKADEYDKGEEVEEMEELQTFDHNNDEDFVSKSRPEPTQNRTNLDIFIAEVIRYGYSDRGAAALYNAALKTVGKIESGEDSLAVDKSKIRRARENFGLKQKLKLKDRVGASGGIQCIGADGKRNKKTRQKVYQNINNNEVEKIVTKSQEHIVYTQEPGGSYLQHSEIAPNKGTGQDLAEDFLEVVIENNSEITLEAIVADGTYTNTGWRDGMIAHLERKLTPPRPLLWLICQAHGNELPLRALFAHCDGGHGTSGPNSFEGPLGKACCKDVHLGIVVKFSPIYSSLPDLDEPVWKDLSRDQKLLYRYTKAIAAGTVPDSLAPQVAGPINHARWLTLAIRLMILYTRTDKPCKGLCMVVKYVVQVYSVVWFLIKKESKFTHGPSHLYKQIILVQAQSLEVQTVVKPAMQRNAYLAHPSVILCAMLESSEKTVRCKAIKMIKEARERPPKIQKMKVLKGVRKFSIPALNWNPSSWWDIIDWKTVKIYEPSILKKLDSEKLNATKLEPFSFPKFPLHSQSVERSVKLVTEAASKVVGEERRHQHILSIIEARKIRKPNSTKSDLKYNENAE